MMDLDKKQGVVGTNIIEMDGRTSGITSRQRLLAALKCQAIDRVPISCYGLVGWDLDSWYYKQSSYEQLLSWCVSQQIAFI